MPIRVNVAEECDARDDASSTTAGNIILITAEGVCNRLRG